jgi:hypothetical protein
MQVGPVVFGDTELADVRTRPPRSDPCSDAAPVSRRFGRSASLPARPWRDRADGARARRRRGYRRRRATRRSHGQSRMRPGGAAPWRTPRVRVRSRSRGRRRGARSRRRSRSVATAGRRSSARRCVRWLRRRAFRPAGWRSAARSRITARRSAAGHRACRRPRDLQPGRGWRRRAGAWRRRRGCSPRSADSGGFRTV